ncbi:MAG: hypothetical protein QMB63_04240 [Clostridiaceae bacterium]
MQGIMEAVFDAAYLTTVITLGILMIKRSSGIKQYLMFGIMAVVLGSGDSFHLIPRAVALNTTGLANYVSALGIGKLITSITMTIFYIILYHVWRERYKIEGKKNLTYAVYGLAVLRIVLCLFPQNGWTSPDPSLTWGIIRNIPFAILGLVIIVIYYNSSREHSDVSFKNMWLTIVLSFAFYIPVVLFADKYPMVGILMIPKTCAYVWTVLIGYKDMMKTLKLGKTEAALS